jgi:hypothetical protein
MMNRWSITAIVCLAAATAHGETYHVAPSGAQFTTIQQAADVATSGDTVIIHAGTYAGFLVTASGTESAPIVFRGDGTVQIDGSITGNRDAVRANGNAYVVFENLTVTGATRAGISAENCHHITVRTSRIDQNGRWGVFSSFCDDLLVEDNEVSRSGSEHGVYASNSADRPVIRRNTIWGNGMCGVHMNGDINYGGDGVISGAVVEGNIIRDNGALGGSGINGDGITNALIRNNVLDGNHASGISLYRIDGGAGSSSNKVINNTIVMASDARWAINIQDGSTGNTLRNNILLHPSSTKGAVTICATCTAGTVSNHNAVVGRFMVGSTIKDLPGWRAALGGDAASFVATEAQLFASATDRQLLATSLALDTGAATDAPATDITDAARPQGASIDIGAYEYVVGGGPQPEPEPDPGDGSGSGSGSGDGSGEDDVGAPPVDESTGCSAPGRGG